MADQWSRISESNKNKLLGTAKKTIKTMGKRILRISPVDTGLFKESWRTAINIPDLSITGPGAGLLPTLKLLRFGDVLFFTNNQPYALRLEFGHSNQAPLGMVRVTGADFQGVVNRSIKIITSPVL